METGDKKDDAQQDGDGSSVALDSLNKSVDAAIDAAAGGKIEKITRLDWDSPGTVARRITGSSLAVLIAYDPMYKATLVYAYGPFSLYQGLSSRLFERKEKSIGPATALCTFGGLKQQFGEGAAGLVWVNNDVPLKMTIASFIHEITHLSQDILRHADVEDSHGEAQAYFVEHESARVLKEFFGMECDNTRLIGIMNSICQAVDNIYDDCEKAEADKKAAQADEGKESKNGETPKCDSPDTGKA